VFQLGRKYADAFGLTARGPDGKPLTVTMGSYGIGITRAVAALAEQTLDEKGLCWPHSVAPADVHLLATERDNSRFEAAEALAADLDERGVRVLYGDWRGFSAGVKFTDAQLLGRPSRCHRTSLLQLFVKGEAGGLVDEGGRAVQVFLSYRRNDVGGYAGRLSDDLRQRMGAKSVFLDVTAIGLGEAFTAAIDRALDESDAVVAVIGPGWLTASTPEGSPRLLDRDDYVRLELARVLQREVRVVPILVGGASLPTADALPEDLRGLVERQGMVLRDESWHQDVESLVRSLRGEPAVPTMRRRRWLISASAAVVVIGLGAGAWWLWAPASGSGTGHETGRALEIRPDHGRISTAFVVSGTGCPQGRQINVIFDAKSLSETATCQANHTYLISYSPNQNGVLPWSDGMGNQHTLTLSPGTTYTVYAQTPTGDWVSLSATYRVE
jgi:TIR domain